MMQRGPLGSAEALWLRPQPRSASFSVPSVPLTPFLLRALPQEITQIPTSDCASMKYDLSQAKFQTLLLLLFLVHIQNQLRKAAKSQFFNTLTYEL